MKKYTISLGEKIRFGFSDIGVNLAFYMITSYFMLYLTDVVGLPSKIVGTIFLIAMLFDAINDPIIGGIADRTRTKIGTYRPWMIAASCVNKKDVTNKIADFRRFCSISCENWLVFAAKN